VQIDVPVSSAVLMTAAGTNAQGDIVGYWFDADAVKFRGFVLKHGSFTLNGATATSAVGINAKGQIVGSYTDAAGTFHGFELTRGHFQTIDVPSAKHTSALGINAPGEIVGQYLDTDDFSLGHGFMLTDGQVTQIDVPDAQGFVTAKHGDMPVAPQRMSRRDHSGQRWRRS
jgi:uncharacterized membrane protein